MSDQPDGSANLLEDLRQLEDLIEQIDAALSAQREQLRGHRLAMPSSVLTSFRQLQAEFQLLKIEALAEQTELRQLRALGEMAVRMTNSLDADIVLAETMELVILLTQAERGYIILARQDSDEYDFRVSSESGLLGLSNPDGSPPQISMSVVNQVISSGEPLLADNAYQDERWSGSQSIVNFTLRSVLCVPLRFRNESIGAVYVDCQCGGGGHQ